MSLQKPWWLKISVIYLIDWRKLGIYHVLIFTPSAPKQDFTVSGKKHELQFGLNPGSQ